MKTIRGRKGRAKYGNRKAKYKGMTFASKLEMECWLILESKQAKRLIIEKGQIFNLERQVSFSIEVNGQHICRYVADYVFITCTGRRVVADAKGMLTPEFRLKAKLLKATDGIDIVIWKSPADVIKWFKEN